MSIKCGAADVRTNADQGAAELVRLAQAAALDLFRRIDQCGPSSLSQAELKVLGWSVRLIERPGTCGVQTGEQEGDAS